MLRRPAIPASTSRGNVGDTGADCDEPRRESKREFPALLRGGATLARVRGKVLRSVFSDIEHDRSATSQMTTWGKRRSGVARP